MKRTTLILMIITLLMVISSLTSCTPTKQTENGCRPIVNHTKMIGY